MLRNGRQAVGTFLVLLCILPSIGACTSTQHIPLESSTSLKRATGVTTRSGRKVQFSIAGASIVNDTLYAVGRAGELIIPTDSIATVSKPKFSAIRTVGMVGALAAGALLVALIALSHSGLNISP